MSRFRNILGATPLVAWYAWGLSRQIPLLVHELSALTHTETLDALLLLNLIAQGVSVLFISLVILLLFVREQARASSREVAPTVAALVGTFAVSSFLFLPARELSPALLTTATAISVVGFSLSLYALLYLGRSFAILPGARSLVTTGPYLHIRHPLYLFEEVAVIGIALQFALPWALVILVVHLAAQILRMGYEEKILSAAFPEYISYAARTARLIPGVY